MSHDHGLVCRCMADHRPHPLELNLHHVWPLGMGGPDTPDNLVPLCPTTHTNVHELLRHLMRYGPLTSGEVGELYDVPVNRYAYVLAMRGYLEWRVSHDATT